MGKTLFGNGKESLAEKYMPLMGSKWLLILVTIVRAGNIMQ